MLEECLDSEENYMNYRISFDSSGSIVVFDKKGEAIQGEEVKFPIPASNILGIKNVTIVEAEGSHYIIVWNGTTPTKYYLRH